jgi:hypothetical protein
MQQHWHLCILLLLVRCTLNFELFVPQKQNTRHELHL